MPNKNRVIYLCRSQRRLGVYLLLSCRLRGIHGKRAWAFYTGVVRRLNLLKSLINSIGMVSNCVRETLPRVSLDTELARGGVATTPARGCRSRPPPRWHLRTNPCERQVLGSCAPMRRSLNATFAGYTCIPEYLCTYVGRWEGLAVGNVSVECQCQDVKASVNINRQLSPFGLMA